MKARYWSLAVVLLLVNYLIFANLFTKLVDPKMGSSLSTRTPVPTFTPAPAQLPAFVIPTLTPVPPIPTATATRVIQPHGASANNNPGEGNPQEAAAQPEAQLVAPDAVNVRSGPGTNFAVVGALNANTPARITGRNADTSWWQIEITPGSIGWVSGDVVGVSGAEAVPVVDAGAAPAAAVPQPVAVAASSVEAPKPKYQYEPTGWYDDGNAGLTRFLGTITDVSGNPVNGAFVRASCGDYSTISFPSGPVGWGPRKESSDWPPGFYDITVDTKPVPCMWILSVVETDDRQTVKTVLSEEVPVEITMKKSIITANWRKNW